MKKVLGFFVLLFLVCAVGFVSADMGPKPSAFVEVNYKGLLVEDGSRALMLWCWKESRVGDRDLYRLDDSIRTSFVNFSEYDSVKNCYWEMSYSWPDENCEKGVCSFHYMIPSEFKLAVFIPSLNETFISNSILRNNFDSTYEMNIYSDGSAIIEETTPFFNLFIVRSFLLAISATLLSELLVWLIFLKRRGLSLKILWKVALANILSISILWFVLAVAINAILNDTFMIWFILGELLVIIFEMFLIRYWSGKQFSLLASGIVCLIANILSIFLGYVILMIRFMYG